MGVSPAVYRPMQIPLWSPEGDHPGKTWTLPPSAAAQDPDAEVIRICATHRIECLEDPDHPVHDIWCVDGPHPVKIFLTQDRASGQILSYVDTSTDAVGVPPKPRRRRRH